MTINPAGVAEGCRNPIIGGGGALVYPSIHSPNFVTEVSGWIIRQDGSAEFDNVTIRGGEVVGGGTFVYSGTPALGNTPIAWLSLATADPFGNPIIPGVFDFFPSTGFAYGANEASFVGWYFLHAGVWSQVVAETAAGTVYTGGSSPQGGVVQAITLGLPYKTTVFPSGDPTGATDWANISLALSGASYAGISAAGTFTAELVPGTYYLNAPLVIPDQGCLAGPDPSWGIPTGNYGAGSLPLQGAIIRAGSGFAGTSLISMGSAGAVQHGGQRLYGITVSGTGAPAGTHGIESIGYVGGVKMRDVVVWGMPGDGLHVVNDGTAGHQADFWQVDSSKFSDCGGWGVLTVGLSDSWFINTESTGNTAGGWNITGGADTRWVACRADSNGSVPGWSLTPTGTGNFLEFTNCEANLNGTGWVFNGGSAAPYFLTGCIAHGNTTAAYSYAAGAAVRTDGGNFAVWVPLAPQNGWANSGVGPAAQYCWRGSSIEVIADMTAGTLVAGTGVLALPGAAALAHAQALPLMDETTRTAQAQINAGTGGTLSFFQGIGAVAAADRCFLHGFLSADA